MFTFETENTPELYWQALISTLLYFVELYTGKTQHKSKFIYLQSSK